MSTTENVSPIAALVTSRGAHGASLMIDALIATHGADAVARALAMDAHVAPIDREISHDLLLATDATYATIHGAYMVAARDYDSAPDGTPQSRRARATWEVAYGAWQDYRLHGNVIAASTEISHRSRVQRGATRGTVVATSRDLAMVMWDVSADGSVNTAGRAYWYPVKSLTTT